MTGMKQVERTEDHHGLLAMRQGICHKRIMADEPKNMYSKIYRSFLAVEKGALTGLEVDGVELLLVQDIEASVLGVDIEIFQATHLVGIQYVLLEVERIAEITIARRDDDTFAFRIQEVKVPRWG